MIVVKLLFTLHLLCSCTSVSAINNIATAAKKNEEMKDGTTRACKSKASLTAADEPESKMKNFNTASLEALQDGDQRKVMDLVDKLRRVGLQHILQLPQLVVTGDQSSGKSSVLEAITEIPFPRKENLCTRFATEIVLRRATEESITTHITPDKARPVDEQKKFQDFARSIKDFAELPDLIEEATELMGLGNNDPLQPARAFSKDILKLEISGPGRPQL